MSVAMVQVGIMRVPMRERFMAMPMRVRFSRRRAGRMRVLMMLIMHMPVFVLHGLVRMVMVMTLGEVQPQPGRHQRPRCQ